MLLAVDTSTRLVGVALYDGVQVLSEVTWHSRDHHTVELAPTVNDVLGRVGVKAADLKVLAVATGPGSFSGLRIGLAFAKGLALAVGIPVLGIPTLDILAAAQPVVDFPLVAVLQAGRGRLAVGWFQAAARSEQEAEQTWQLLRQPEVMDVQALSQMIQKPTLVCGELNAEERHILARKRKNVVLASPAQSVRRPAFLAELAWQRWQAGERGEAASLAPIYLHIGDPIPEATQDLQSTSMSSTSMSTDEAGDAPRDGQ